MRSFAILMIAFYQRAVSPLKGSVCRFYPTCSEYAREAILKHGLRKGCWQALRRFLRCHPLNPGGHDPVN